MKAYTYVIAIGAGVAPNFEPPMATLAICKPKIRLGAEPRDLVIAFTGARISPEPHGVCWAGVVKTKQTLAKYWENPEFAPKKPGRSKMPDNIYKQAGGAIVQVPNSSHGSDSAARDIGGQYALTFDPAWYFGAAAPVLPIRFNLRMIGGRRGHRVVELSDSRWRDLKNWLDEKEKQTEVIGPSPTLKSRCGPVAKKCS